MAGTEHVHHKTNPLAEKVDHFRAQPVLEIIAVQAVDIMVEAPDIKDSPEDSLKRSAEFIKNAGESIREHGFVYDGDATGALQQNGRAALGYPYFQTALKGGKMPPDPQEELSPLSYEEQRAKVEGELISIIVGGEAHAEKAALKTGKIGELQTLSKKAMDMYIKLQGGSYTEDIENEIGHALDEAKNAERITRDNRNDLERLLMTMGVDAEAIRIFIGGSTARYNNLRNASIFGLKRRRDQRPESRRESITVADIGRVGVASRLPVVFG